MKTTYIKPEVEIIKLAVEKNILNTGSVENYGGGNVDNQGSGDSPKDDGNGHIYIDAKGNNMWDDEN